MTKKRILLILKIVLVLALAAGVVFIAVRQLEYRRGAKIYAEAAELATTVSRGEETETSTQETASEPEVTQPEQEKEEIYIDPEALELETMDLAVLREVNADIIGWLMIPGTDVSYPLLQGEDNSYYLNRTWKKTANSVGSIFMECRNSPDLSDFNTIIYGHNMRNGSMFGSLKKYKDEDYLKAHPSIYIMDDSGIHRYDIFAVHEAGIYTLTYGLDITERETKEEFIDLALSSSVIDTGIVPSSEDRVITLSTCTGNGYSSRLVVQGVLIE